MFTVRSKDFYRFDPVRTRDGAVSKFHREYVDDEDFTLSPRLLQQLGLDTCPETTPEGKALWVYFRLCQILKYDEGYYYSDFRHNPNDNPFGSVSIAGKVTAETPVTCFNFSRIAVKLLNQIEGVHALMISVGSNLGHFRFGYYTDKVSVDAEPSSPHNHYNDMTRVKLGIEPQGLKVFNGKFIMEQLMERMAPQLLVPQQGIQPYLDMIQAEYKIPATTKIDLRHLMNELKAEGLDGSSTVQLLLDVNRHFAQPPYQFMRVATVDSSETYRNLQPKLLVREKQDIFQIDLTTLDLAPLPFEEYQATFNDGKMLQPYESIPGSNHVRRKTFEQGLER